MIQRRAQRPRDRLHLRDAVGVEDGLGDPFQQDHVRGIAQIVVGLDHQQFGIEPGLGEVALGRRVADIGRGTGRHIGAGVVTRRVSGQGEQTDESHGDRHHQDGSGPAHDGRADAPPAPGAHRAGGLEQTEMAADAQHRRRQGQRGHNATRTPIRSGNAQALEIREPGEGQTEHRAGNRQARTQDDVRGSPVHRLERRYPILPGVARFVVAAQNEDRVVCSGGDDQQASADWSSTSTAR